jgi:two-component system cell cycle sensor histidine kinase/response regulator CckA
VTIFPRRYFEPATILLAVLLGAVFWTIPGRLAAAEAAPVAASATAAAPAANGQPITDATWLWAMPGEQKTQVHPLRLEGRVSYYDPGFNMLWLEDQTGLSTYVQLRAPAPDMHTNQRVRIEGTIVPARGLTADTVKVSVLRDYEAPVPIETAGRINDLAALHARMVTVEAYVDGQQWVDAEHTRLSLIVENRPVIGWIRPDSSDPQTTPNWVGKFVRMQALYSGRFDPTQTHTSIELWMSRQSDLQVLGSIDNHRIFSLPVTPINEIYRLARDTQVKVRGQVDAREPGVNLVVRDATGQILVRSMQQARIPIGAEVEAVGRVVTSGAGWVLGTAFYRPVSAADSGAPKAAVQLLQSIAQIRQLSPDEVARGRAVKISGTVIWSLPGADFFFLQDIGGGIRVRFDLAKMVAPALAKYLEVEGTTYNERFAPAVRLTSFRDLGAMNAPPARPITFSQAISGREDGQWIEMRGFLQRTVAEGDWRWIYVTNPEGEFVCHVQTPVIFVANPGSLIRVHGVCETKADRTGQITGVTLRVPFIHDITVEQDAPADFFDLPLTSLKNLDRLNAGEDMTRARVTATVLHAMPGRAIYVEEDGAGLQLLTRETTPLVPGDKIDAVGILGREGTRTILREVVFRKTGSGPAPAPQLISAHAPLAADNDSRLVRMRGTLLNQFDRPEQSRLTLQDEHDDALFEAVLDRPAGGKAQDWLLGAGLELTGLYQLEFDDARQMKGFHLLLRSPADVSMIRRPRLWTVRRALVAAAILGGSTLLGLAWITALRRRVRRQTGQIRAQLEHQARLEIEVQRAARLESLGVLAGGIAHDFNNALTAIMGYASIAMLDAQAMKAAGDCLREIERGAKRARDLTQQLLTFAKGGDPLRTSVTLPELIQEAARLVLHGTPVQCRCDFPEGVWAVDADRAQITQVIQNLLRNARQAMPRDGEITVALANEELTAGAKAAPGAPARSALVPGRYVRMTVTDTGEGIKPEHLPRIFEPYFSTRQSGSGLGLATVHSIVKKHGGGIEVQSAPGQGTMFQVWLPAAGVATAGSLAPAQPGSAGAAAGTPRLLLMDDEESIRQLGALALRKMGYDATVVPDGGSAVREVEHAVQAGQPYDLVILDLTVPGGLGGREAIEQIRQIDPGVPAIVSSGYSSDPVMAHYRDYGFQAVVPKPYNFEQFSCVIETLLKAGRANDASSKP